MRYEKVKIRTKRTEAELTIYSLDNFPAMDMDRIRPMILICPGGGYHFVSEREAEPVAMQMLALGFHAAVLRYHVAPERFPVALAEAACSVAYLREHAAEYHIDPEKIVVAGFSAGGHLTASLGVFWQEAWLKEYTGCDPEQVKPNGMILSYPVITSGEFAHRNSFVNLLGGDAMEEQIEYVSLETRVTELTPPTFIWHTVTDQTVPVENTLLFVRALQRAGVRYEMHIYPQGEHGLSLATMETTSRSNPKFSPEHRLRPECAAWVGMAGRFVKEEL